MSSATSARSRRAISPSSRTPIRCCRSRASRSARPASRRGSSRICAAQAGNLKIEVSAAGRVMRELGRVEGTPGKDLQLTLDLGAAEPTRCSAWPGESAAGRGDRRDERRHRRAGLGAGLRSEQLRLRDQVAASGTPAERRLPAAVATRPSPAPIRRARPSRWCMALAALEAGVVSPGDGVYCPGFTVARQPPLPLLEARRARPRRPAAEPRAVLRLLLLRDGPPARAGPDQRHGAPARPRRARTTCRCRRSRRATCPTPPGRRPSAARSWTTGDSFNYGIGQGFTLASPLQLAVMTARVASGTAVKPRLVRTVDGVPRCRSSRRRPLDVDPQHLNAVRDGMFAVSNEGTAYRSRIVDPAMLMAGKTGTSQVRIITAAERAAGVTKNEQLPWKRRDHALFVCYAPYDKPALRRRPDRRARRRRVGGGGADRARHPALRALRRPAAARGLSARAAQGRSRSSARPIRRRRSRSPAAVPARDRA